MSETYCPTLNLLRQAISPRIMDLAVSVIQNGPSPSIVYRVSLRYGEAHSALSSVVVKAIQPDWPNDPCGADREYTFYTRFLPYLDLKRLALYYAGTDADTRYRVLVMQDLLPDYRFPPTTHLWSDAEARCLLRAYARLHTHGRALLPPPGERDWLLPRYEARLENERIPDMAEELRRMGIWPALPGLTRLIEQTRASMRRFDGQADTLLHNDVYPPNVALPADLNDEAILVDWGMLSWGLAELDMAYLFMQPFRATRLINRAAALAYYWEQRQRAGEEIPSPQERAARQRHADAVLALALTPMAYQRAIQPFPVDSVPWRYWNSMHSVLSERLLDLSKEAT